MVPFNNNILTKDYYNKAIDFLHTIKSLEDLKNLEAVEKHDVNPLTKLAMINDQIGEEVGFFSGINTTTDYIKILKKIIGDSELCKESNGLFLEHVSLVEQLSKSSNSDGNIQDFFWAWWSTTPDLTFYPILLIIQPIAYFLFKKYLGTEGIYSMSIITIVVINIICFFEMYCNIMQNTILCFDLGTILLVTTWIEFRLFFVFDNLALSLTIVVLTLTGMALTFGVEYMSREAFINRVLYLLNMFSSSVVLLFCVYDFFLIMVMWEFIGFFSFLLVNFYTQRIYTIKSAYKTFVFSRISDLAIFTAYILICITFETTDLSVLFHKVPFYMFHMIFIGEIAIHFMFVLSMLIAIAGVVKAAQFFSHVWLPDAMEAPTPASALIHSSTLVIMGIYLIARFSILFEFSPATNYLLAILGAFTIAFGAVMASVQEDIKKLVAYSTISQMGYLVCGCGFCAYQEVIIYLIIHAVNKAFLFVIVGYTVHFYSGDTDLRQISHTYLYASDICIFVFITCINLMGLPYAAGFYSKEYLLFQTHKYGFTSYFIRSMWFISFCFTPIYMLKLAGAIIYYPRVSSLFVYFRLFKDYLINLDWKLSNSWEFSKKGMSMYIQYCFYTSRASALMLILFEIIFCTFGESIVALFSSFTSAVDTNQTDNFTAVKNYNLATSINYTSFLQNSIFFSVVLFTFCGVNNLIASKYRGAMTQYYLFFALEVISTLVITSYILIMF